MCVFVVAHGVSDRYALVIAANRDEEYERPSRPAHFWEDDPSILGGRDLRAGGSWLAISKSGRFAAVTNLRGGSTVNARSRGLLVSDFIRSSEDPASYAARTTADAQQYGGFHLIVGRIARSVAYASSVAPSPRVWPPAIYGVSNGPVDPPWPKSNALIERVQRSLALDGAGPIAADLLDALATPSDDARRRGATRREDLEREVFVIGDRYGTRSSTVIVATSDEVAFFEQNYGRGGVREGGVTAFRFALQL